MMGGKPRHRPLPLSDDRADQIAIVFDGYKWHVRRVSNIVHNLSRDEMIYRCDHPMVNGAKTLRQAVSDIPAGKISPAILVSAVEFIEGDL